MRRVTRLVEDSIFLDLDAAGPTVVALTDARANPRACRHGHPSPPQTNLARTLGVSREFAGKQLTAWRDPGIVELGAGGSLFATPGRSNACAWVSARPAGRAVRNCLAKCELVRRRRP
jgi:hypothetical protein